MTQPNLKKGLLAAACTLAIAGAQPAFADDAESTKQEPRRPNVVLIFADDLGYSDTGFQNISKDVETPRMDELAKDGAIFTAGYVTAPVSGSSRAGLITGRYQQRFGYHDNIGPYTRDKDIVQGLPLDIPTIANRFKDAGYRTGMVGKWHDGDPIEYWPHNRGFEDFFGFNNGAASYFVGPNNLKSYKNKAWSAIYRNDKVVEPFDEYLTDKFGMEAVDYIEKRKDEPFFLYVPFNAIHGPLQAKEEDLKRFSHIENVKRRTAVAMNYNMDLNVGRIVDKLEELDLMEDTMVIFLSDNGGKVNGNYSYNTPLRSQKGTLWDGGIRIPYTITWKGTIPAGQKFDDPVLSLDLLPTAMAAIGEEVKDDWKLDGVDLLPLLKREQKKLEDRYLYWHTPSMAAIRDNDWKLTISNLLGKKPTYALFKISEDIGESKDLIKQYPEEAERLKKAFAEWESQNEEAKWGWAKQKFPHSNGWRGRH